MRGLQFMNDDSYQKYHVCKNTNQAKLGHIQICHGNILERDVYYYQKQVKIMSICLYSYHQIWLNGTQIISLSETMKSGLDAFSVNDQQEELNSDKVHG